MEDILSVLILVLMPALPGSAGSFGWQNLGQVASLSLLVVFGKGIIVILLGLLFPRPARMFLIIAVGLSQIGEFSFILGQSGLSPAGSSPIC
jgi:predicted Kef-type K+ transport protein